MLLALVAAILAIPHAVSATPTHRPMDEMHGGCDSFQMQVDAELLAMTGPANGVMAWPAQGEPRGFLQLLTPIAVTLLPRDHVSLTIEAKRPGDYAGIVAFRVPASGRYRVSLGSSAWVEIVTQNGRIEPTAFEMQSHCPTVFKTIVFSLEADESYWLEVTSAVQEVNVLLTADPQ